MPQKKSSGSRKKSGRKYGKAAGKSVESAMRRKKKARFAREEVAKAEPRRAGSKRLPLDSQKPERKAQKCQGKSRNSGHGLAQRTTL